MELTSLKGLNLKQLLELYEKNKANGASAYELRGHRRYIKYFQKTGREKRFYLSLIWFALLTWFVLIFLTGNLFVKLYYVLFPLWFMSLYSSIKYRLKFDRDLLQINPDKFESGGLIDAGKNWFKKIEKWNKEES